jgi:hypothetical protein
MAKDRNVEPTWLEEVRRNSPWVEATMIDVDGNWLDLLCPKCECKRVKCEDGKPDLGNGARCYECGYEFTITGNCWILNPERNT